MARRWGRLDVEERRRARREREDKSPRLRDEVPKLTSLHFEVSVSHGGTPLPGETHVRRFVIDQAPAYFELRCTHGDCREGGYDVTAAVMHALRGSKESFEVESACSGQAGSAGCPRVLSLVGVAAYRA